jgi:hypothetical protein
MSSNQMRAMRSIADLLWKDLSASHSKRTIGGPVEARVPIFPGHGSRNSRDLSGPQELRSEAKAPPT